MVELDGDVAPLRWSSDKIGCGSRLRLSRSGVSALLRRLARVELMNRCSRAGAAAATGAGAEAEADRRGRRSAQHRDCTACFCMAGIAGVNVQRAN